jgi:hypothetical protein
MGSLLQRGGNDAATRRDRESRRAINESGAAVATIKAGMFQTSQFEACPSSPEGPSTTAPVPKDRRFFRTTRPVRLLPEKCRCSPPLQSWSQAPLSSAPSGYCSSGPIIEVEIIGGVSVLMPSYSALGALLLNIVDVGALVAQIAVLHMDWIHPIIIGALLAALVYLQRDKILRITRQSRV